MIRNEGTGIESADTGISFEVFQRLPAVDDERAGAGIGFARRRRIVERHDGRIWVESGPGEGSAFSFTPSAASDYDE